MTVFGYCSVSNGGCKAPVGRRVGSVGGQTCFDDEPPQRVAICRLCGDLVCTDKNCSRLIGSARGPGGRFRVCRNCEEEAASRVAPRKERGA